MSLYAPGEAEILEVARRAQLTNTHPLAKIRLTRKLLNPPGDWDCRTFYAMPGMVWTVGSDTCGTGRPNAPRNIALDETGREIVFRQPANAQELTGIMSAESQEVFSCYRFDGLDRWTQASWNAWFDSHEVLVGWLKNALSKTDGSYAGVGLDEYEAYLAGEEFRSYAAEISEYLRHREVESLGVSG